MQLPAKQLDAELHRFSARRIVRGLLLVGILIVLLVVVIGTAKGHRGTTVTIDPVTGSAIGRGSFSGSGSFELSPDGRTQLFVTDDTRMNVGKDLEKVLEGTGIALLFAGFAIGASFVGAEYNVGSLTTQLLFEPRRGSVHTAKAAAVAIGTAVFTLAILTLLAVSMYVGSAVHGVVSGVDGSFVVDRVGEALRIAAVVGTGAAMSYSVTLVTRRSSAGMIACYLQYPLLFLLNPDKMPFGLISHYAPVRALIAAVLDPTHASGVNERTIHTMAGGVVLTIVWLLAILAGSGWWFARTEVR